MMSNLSQSKSDEKNLSTKIKWIGFKQLFFNSTIIAKERSLSLNALSARSATATIPNI